jgi:hypothetical protein
MSFKFRFSTIIRNVIWVFVVFLLGGKIGLSQSWLVNSNHWSATDALGRKLVGVSEVGDQKTEKLVGMFYWTWHQQGPGDQEPHNLMQLLSQYDDITVEAMMNDFFHVNWEGIHQFFWDEPLFGYYRTTDEWVLRKHAELLADAGVDVVFFDTTNGDYTWRDSYTKLLEVWSQARLDGVKTPQIAFLLPFGPTPDAMSIVVELYTDLYKPGIFQDLWFMWDKKPLIMAYPESLVPVIGTTVGMKFTAKAPFYAINAMCPSWGNNIGNLTFKLYRWSNSYDETISGIPLYEKTYIDFYDNQKLQLTFDELEAGDYMWKLSDGTEKVGVWKWIDSDNSAVSFYNGEYVDGNYVSGIAYAADLCFSPLTTGTTKIPIEIKGRTVSQEEVDTMKRFFTFRPAQPEYVQGPTRNDHWGWLEVYPQHGFPVNALGNYEQVCVSVAQNASPHSNKQCTSFNGPDTFGRNYTGPISGNIGSWDYSEDSFLKGANFQQQWDWAVELDPKLIWVTGWNEWIFGRFESWPGCYGGPQVVTSFPDNFDKYRSRDIEPVKSWGNKGDVYYMQLVDNVRRFKGMNKQDPGSGKKTIDISNLDCWENVYPYYRAYRGSVVHRNHAGHGSSLVYENTSGRNDIIGAKVARDDQYLYFYVETNNQLTDKSDPKWMRLFIDIDRNKSTGWEGYDFVVNRIGPTETAFIERSYGNWIWEIIGSADYSVFEKSLVLKIPLIVIGVLESEALDFEFKWSDNMQEDGNIMDFYINGDVAPGGRFNYVYNVNSDVLGGIEETEKSLILFPNPTLGEFQLHSAVPMKNIIIYNLLGEKIQNHNLKNGEYYFGGKIGSESGLYMLDVLFDNGERKVLRMLKK